MKISFSSVRAREVEGAQCVMNGVLIPMLATLRIILGATLDEMVDAANGATEERTTTSEIEPGGTTATNGDDR